MASKSSVRCLITAGPTREYFDPVRFISNPSSGKMGYALAEAAVALGWSVDLVSGPVSLPVPAGVTCQSVMTGEEMFQQVERLFVEADVLIMTAAVCDMRPKHYQANKVKKGALSMTLEMEPVVDILKTVSAKKKPEQCVVGFAAETEQIEAHALKKLKDKHLDWIAANQVGGESNAFESDRNALLLMAKDGRRLSIGPASKKEVAEAMLAILAEDWPQ